MGERPAKDALYDGFATVARALGTGGVPRSSIC